MAGYVIDGAYGNSPYTSWGDQSIAVWVAKIVRAEGNESELENLRDKLSYSGMPSTMAIILQRMYPEIFQILITPYDAAASFPQVRREDFQTESSRFMFDENFVNDVKNALDDLKNDRRFSQGAVDAHKHQVKFADSEIAVGRIWTVKHKTSYGAARVLQQALESLETTLGCESAKKTRLFSMISTKIRNVTEGERDAGLFLKLYESNRE